MGIAYKITKIKKDLFEAYCFISNSKGKRIRVTEICRTAKCAEARLKELIPFLTGEETPYQIIKEDED